MLKELVEHVVKKLVDKPEAVVVNQETANQTIIIKLRVDSEDLGKVIGKEGRMARSIRTLVHAAALRDGKRAVLEIMD
ncbi:KH domain-containing protein [Candidatus Babeliales bacterium]|nr:KH domain-containing protein [Candidatus Babeliales bacterium]